MGRHSTLSSQTAEERPRWKYSRTPPPLPAWPQQPRPAARLYCVSVLAPPPRRSPRWAAGRSLQQGLLATRQRRPQPTERRSKEVAPRTANLRAAPSPARPRRRSASLHRSAVGLPLPAAGSCAAPQAARAATTRDFKTMQAKKEKERPPAGLPGVRAHRL